MGVLLGERRTVYVISFLCVVLKGFFPGVLAFSLRIVSC